MNSTPASEDDLRDRISVLEAQSVLDRDLIGALEAQAAADRAAIENLIVALDTARQIGSAIGIVMVTEKVTSEQAFARLKEASQARHRKLREIADQVVFTGHLDQSDADKCATRIGTGQSDESP